MKNIAIAFLMFLTLAATSCKKKSNTTGSSGGSSGYRSGNISKQNKANALNAEEKTK